MVRGALMSLPEVKARDVRPPQGATGLWERRAQAEVDLKGALRLCRGLLLRGARVEAREGLLGAQGGVECEAHDVGELGERLDEAEGEGVMLSAPYKDDAARERLDPCGVLRELSAGGGYVALFELSP